MPHSGFLVSFCNTFAAPTALAKAGYWVYFFFTMWDLLEFAVIWLFFVETAGRTLGEKCFSRPQVLSGGH